MTTRIKPELSEKNQYYLDRHRYYELKHFCLQYPLWKKKLSVLDGYKDRSVPIKTPGDILPHSKTEDDALLRIFYSERMDLVEKAAKETDDILGKYVFIGATLEMPYDTIRLKYNIPCSKDVYYKMYRRFFWILSKLRR